MNNIILFILFFELFIVVETLSTFIVESAFVIEASLVEILIIVKSSFVVVKSLFLTLESSFIVKVAFVSAELRLIESSFMDFLIFIIWIECRFILIEVVIMSLLKLVLLYWFSLFSFFQLRIILRFLILLFLLIL